MLAACMRTSVDVDDVAHERADHGAALDVPARPAGAPRRGPRDLARLGRLPQRKVGGVALPRVHRHTLARPEHAHTHACMQTRTSAQVGPLCGHAPSRRRLHDCPRMRTQACTRRWHAASAPGRHAHARTARPCRAVRGPVVFLRAARQLAVARQRRDVKVYVPALHLVRMAVADDVLRRGPKGSAGAEGPGEGGACMRACVSRVGKRACMHATGAHTGDWARCTLRRPRPAQATLGMDGHGSGGPQAPRKRPHKAPPHPCLYPFGLTPL